MMQTPESPGIGLDVPDVAWKALGSSQACDLF